MDDNVIRNHPSTEGKWEPSDPLNDLTRSRRRSEDLEPDWDLEKERALENDGVLELDIIKEANAVCVDCTHCDDPRPFYKRWFTWFWKLRGRDLLCLAKPLQAVEHPVTGETTYTSSMFGTPSKGLYYGYDYCDDVNPFGECHLFEHVDEEDDEPSFYGV